MTSRALLVVRRVLVAAAVVSACAGCATASANDDASALAPASTVRSAEPAATVSAKTFDRFRGEAPAERAQIESLATPENRRLEVEWVSIMGRADESVPRGQDCFYFPVTGAKTGRGDILGQVCFAPGEDTAGHVESTWLDD